MLDVMHGCLVKEVTTVMHLVPCIDIYPEICNLLPALLDTSCPEKRVHAAVQHKGCQDGMIPVPLKTCPHCCTSGRLSSVTHHEHFPGVTGPAPLHKAAHLVEYVLLSFPHTGSKIAGQAQPAVSAHRVICCVQ